MLLHLHLPSLHSLLLALDTLINMCGGKSFSGFPSRFSAGDTSILGRVILLYQTRFDVYLIKIERPVSFEGETHLPLSLSLFESLLTFQYVKR